MHSRTPASPLAQRSCARHPLNAAPCTGFAATRAAPVRGVDKSLVRAAVSLGATRRVLIMKVVLPATLPSLFTGFRIALGVSWMSIVAAELIASSSGLGFMINYYRELLRSDLILVGM